MTLLEILVKELNEWPNGAEFAFQFDYNTCITFMRSEHPRWVSNYGSKYTADESGELACVTREEYLAAKEALTKPVETPDKEPTVPTYETALQHLERLEHFLSEDKLLLGSQQWSLLQHCTQIRNVLQKAYEERPAVEEMMLYIDPAWELGESALEDFREFCTALHRAGYTKNEEK